MLVRAESEGRRMEPSADVRQTSQWFHMPIVVINQIDIIATLALLASMAVRLAVNSTLGGGFLLSLAAFFYGKLEEKPDLANAAEPFLWLFGVIWVIFVLLSIGRNVRSW